MKRGRGTFEQPPPAAAAAAKRARAMSVSVGGGGVEAVASPRSQKLRRTFFMVIIMVRMGLRTSVPASISQIGGMFQRYVDQALPKCQELISRLLWALLETHTLDKLYKLEAFQGQVESKLGTLQGQVEGLRNEVRQLARLCSGRHADRHTRVETNQEHASASGSNTNIRLCFLNRLKQPIYTDKNITTDDNAGIKVTMCEDDNIITSGSLSRVKVEILVLRGDFSANCKDSWTKDEFDEHIVQGRSGQPLMLHTARLTNGQVEINQIRFTEGSCRTPSRTFILAARVCKSENTNVRVQEAVMNPVTVLDRRNEANEKRHPPTLDDDVYRLEEIAKDGVYHKRLIEAKIYKVGGFLKALNEDEDKLKEILQMEKKPKSWSKLIRHAKDCVLGDRQELKRYESEEGNLALLFNYVHDLVGAEFHGDYVACEGFDSAQKALVNKWKVHAYNQLADIPFDYVMKGNVPEPISSSIVAPAGPPVLAYQGIEAAKSLPGDEHLAGPIYPNADCDPMMTALRTCYYQDQGPSLVDRPQMFQPPVVSGCEQRPQLPMDSPYQFELSEMDFYMASGASTYAQLSYESGHLPEALQMASADAATRPMTAPAQPSFADQEQPPFPGSGFGNNY
ncbi:hypothetical protein ACP4OV_023257 [Aristida adscensionis]